MGASDPQFSASCVPRPAVMLTGMRMVSRSRFVHHRSETLASLEARPPHRHLAEGMERRDVRLSLRGAIAALLNVVVSSLEARGRRWQ